MEVEMKAAVYKQYGGPEVVQMEEIARPVPRKGEILVRIGAAGVTTADWRLRAAAFPGLISTVAGRFMFGVFRPRKPVLGSDFAGTVAELGEGVTEFAVGDRVFGFDFGGAHAEYATVKADGAVLKTPGALGDVDAAALPFGALSSLEFLDRFAGVKPGEKVLVVGASGGVGAYAVQIAKALGAEVTAVASAERSALVTELGADRFVDYRATPPETLSGPFDVVFDTVGALSYPRAAHMLAAGGRFVPLNFGLSDMGQSRQARRPWIGQRAHRVEDHIKGAAQRLGRGRAIVDETIRAQFRHKRRPFRRSDRRHLRAQRLRAGFYTREPVEELQRRQRAKGQCRRLGVAEGPGRLQDRAIGLHRGVFRVRPAEVEAKHPVAHRELGHALAQFGHRAREIAPEHRLARPEDAEHEPPGDRADQARKRRGAQPPVRCRDAGRANPHEDFTLARHGARDLFHLHDLGPTVLLVNCRFHLDLHALSHSMELIYLCVYS